MEDFTQTLISNIFQDFKKKNISKNVRNFFKFLEKKNLKIPKESNFICKSSDIYVNPATVPNIQNRYKEKITKQSPWLDRDLLVELKELQKRSFCNISYLER